MGAYSYCEKCRAPLGPPTLREELIYEERDCPHCGATDPLVHARSPGEVIIELVDEIEELEDRITKIERELR